MSAPAPISYLFDFLSYPENLRKCRLNEFAANGAKHLVLSSPLLKHLIAHPEQAKKFAAELTESGLSFGDAHAPYGMHWDLICVFEEERPALFIRQKMALTMAAELGCKTVTMHTGADHLFPEIPAEKHLSRACDMLEKLLPEAEKLNIVIAVENGWSKLTSLDTLLSRSSSPWVGWVQEAQREGFSFSWFFSPCMPGDAGVVSGSDEAGRGCGAGGGREACSPPAYSPRIRCPRSSQRPLK